jgi:hypothetical protein
LFGALEILGRAEKFVSEVANETEEMVQQMVFLYGNFSAIIQARVTDNTAAYNLTTL